MNSLDGTRESQETEIMPERPESSVCEFCFGTGTRLEPGRGAAICDCRRTNSKERLLKASRIPVRFQKRSFDNYYPRNDSQSLAVSIARTFVDQYPAVDRGLLLTGGLGVGKTHLAIAILRGLIEKKGVSCLFYESGSLLKAIQESYSSISQTSEMRVLAPVYEAEVLVLDELGATVPTDWVRDTLYQIINTRYNNKKVTIFTTNYMDELKVDEEQQRLKSKLAEISNGEYSSGRANEAREIEKRLRNLREAQPLQDRIGATLRSRLYEMCGKLEIKGQDFRKGM